MSRYPAFKARSAPYLYDDFAWIHTRKGDDFILTAGFFPWHRYFILSYETALHDHCNYTGRMPYWDWTLDWSDFHASPLWDEDTGFGGDGDHSAPESVGRGHCVTTGPFSDLKPMYYDRDLNSHCLSRAIRRGETLDFAMSKISPSAVEKLMLKGDYHDFTHWLEKDAHKAMPYSIQGDWMQTSAPNGNESMLHSSSLRSQELRSRFLASTCPIGSLVVALAIDEAGDKIWRYVWQGLGWLK